jgi:hypothetical protein
MHQILLPSNSLNRLRNSYRFPLQAALAARAPLIGRRVPLRGYWRRQPLQLMRPAEPMLGHLLQPVSFASAVCSSVAHVGVTAGGRVVAATRRIDRRATLALAGASAGALAMFYLDPQQGRRRRALVRDQIAHAGHIFGREVPHTIERRGRYLRGVARGVRHEAAEFVSIDGGHPRVDDETLVARVRSEALRDAGFKAGQINIDAYEGCVTLRGQLEHPDEIRRLINGTKRVEGVIEVRSYLHLPGTLPPNKAESYLHLPEHMASR